MLEAVDYVIIAGFSLLFLLHKVVRDWYGVRETPRRVDLQAEELLVEDGYRIAARAAVKYIDFTIDGRRHRQKVKADLIARRGRKKYVVEVNGKDGTSVRNSDIRRRLLEYQVAFAPDGIIAVDVDRNRVRQISINNRHLVVKVLALATALTLGAVLYLLVR